MRKVSILIPLHDNYFANCMSLEDAMANSGITDFEILFFNNGSSDTKVKEWAMDIVMRKPGSQYFESDVIKRNSEVLNILLNNANNEYICIIPFPTFLPKNWLFEMICANAQIIGSGITCIADHNNSFELDQFCYRVGKLGLSNYYLCDYHGIKVAHLTSGCYFETTKEEYHDTLIKMNKENNYTIKISQATENEKVAMKEVSKVMNKFKSIFKKQFYIELSETFGFEIIGFAQDETKHLDEFCQKHKLQWIVLPGKTMARAITIQFYDKQT